MLAVPAPVLVAMPVDATAATLVLEDVHDTQSVTSLVVPSLKSARAVNCVNPPCSRSALAGDTVSEVGVAMTVKVAVPTCPSNSATMVAVPGSSPVASPIVGDTSLMVATDAGEDVHKTDVVRSCVLPSANVPIATKATPVCWGMLAADGETRIDVSGEDSTRIAESPLSEPSCAVMVAFPGDCAVTLPPVLTLATLDADEVQVTMSVIT